MRTFLEAKLKNALSFIKANMPVSTIVSDQGDNQQSTLLCNGVTSQGLLHHSDSIIHLSE